MTKMTLEEAFVKVKKMGIFDKLTTNEMFELYDIIVAVNLSGWHEGKKTALQTFAIDIAKVIYPEDYVS
tara:strand:- start:284 stop:490 length:207 start_codon:yes stop_codon:yes gene_type:complete